MKKIYFIFSLILLVMSSSLQAQVVNGNFEIVKPNFLPSNWGMNFTQEVAIDTNTGQVVGDNILYTWCIPSMVYVSTEAHSGQYAMEISNAFNSTQNVVIPGSATIFSDETQDFPGWNAGVPLSPQANIQTLGFYYKFLPAGNDVAQANISVFDANGNEIGKTHVDIMGTNNQFQYVYSYVNFTSNTTPAHMTISFTMQKEGSTPTFGSRLLIDQVVTNFQSLEVIGSQNSNTSFTVYPTLADNEINVSLPNQAEGQINYKIINTQGSVVIENSELNASNYTYSMDVSNLSSGVYFLQIESNLEKVVKKFVKK